MLPVFPIEPWGNGQFSLRQWSSQNCLFVGGWRITWFLASGQARLDFRLIVSYCAIKALTIVPVIYCGIASSLLDVGTYWFLLCRRKKREATFVWSLCHEAI